MADALKLLRDGATLLAAAIEAEMKEFLVRFKNQKTANGRQRWVRNGH